VKLRTKLLLAHTPVLATLVVIMVAAAYIAWRLGDAPGSILHENFRSFDAGRGMLVAIDAIDRDVLAPPWREAEAALRAITEQRAAFERELELQRSNITEDGELEVTGRLEAAWQDYVAGLLEMAKLESGSARLEPVPVPVRELVADAIARHEGEARRQGTTLEAVPGDASAVVSVDPERIRHVFDNGHARAGVRQVRARAGHGQARQRPRPQHRAGHRDRARRDHRRRELAARRGPGVVRAAARRFDRPRLR
jgi:signal transduction histidine kinase